MHWKKIIMEQLYPIYTQIDAIDVESIMLVPTYLANKYFYFVLVFIFY